MSLDLNPTMPAEGDDNLVIAVTSTSAATAIPTGLFGRYVSISAEDADVYFVCGDASVEADDTATSGDTRCDVVFSGTERTRQFSLPGEYTHIALKTASGTATCRIIPTSRKPGVSL